jgi:hypothetical protein
MASSRLDPHFKSHPPWKKSLVCCLDFLMVVAQFWNDKNHAKVTFSMLVVCTGSDDGFAAPGWL